MKLQLDLNLTQNNLNSLKKLIKLFIISFRSTTPFSSTLTFRNFLLMHWAKSHRPLMVILKQQSMAMVQSVSWQLQIQIL